MIENLNSIEHDSIIKMVQGILSRLKDIESKLLRLRSTLQPTVYDVLANGATDMQFDINSVVKVTPNADATLTSSVPTAGVSVYLMVLTSGTTPYTLTFGAGFKSTGTLSTGATSSRMFVLHFISDGTNLYEVSRTVAIVV